MAYKKKMTNSETEVADQVADEILTVNEKDNRIIFFLILLFLISLIFLVSSISFAVFDNYYNGGKKTAIDIGTDVVIDEKKKNIDNDNNNNNNKSKDDSGNKNTNDNSSKKKSDNKKKDKPTKDDSKKDNPIVDPSVVLFNFNEKSNYIYMVNVLPTSDEVGKTLSGDREYFDFNISTSIKGNKKGNVVYEISFVPIAGNTINPKDIRVYLTEDDNPVSVTGNEINTYSKLPNSSYRTNGKVLYRKKVSDSFSGNYVFRMWYAYDANLYKESKKFGGKIAVDAYYE